MIRLFACLVVLTLAVACSDEDKTSDAGVDSGSDTSAEVVQETAPEVGQDAPDVVEGADSGLDG